MAEPSKFRFVSYTRDMSVQKDKFKQLNRLVNGARQTGDVDAVVVASPEVLGDTYEELVDNLNKLAGAELALVIVPPPAEEDEDDDDDDDDGRDSA